MSTQTKLIPTGYKFTDTGVIPSAWEVTSLGCICNYRNGKSLEKYITDIGLYNLITLNSIDIKGKLKNKHLKVNLNNNSLKKGDIVMILSDVAHGNFLGLTDIIPDDNKYVLNQRIGSLRIISDDIVKYVSLFINYNQKYFKMSGKGSSQQNLGKSDILDFKIFIPPLHEQTAITNALTDIDQLIHSLEKKIAKKQAIKQGTIQNLLSPCIDWEKKSLDVVCSFMNGKPYEKEVADHGTINLITLDSISINGKLKDNHKKILSYDGSLKKGDIVTVLSDIAHARLLGLCDVILVNDLFVLNQRMGRLRCFQDYPFFVKLRINKHQEYFRMRGQGSSQKHIYRKDFDEFDICLPTYDEQVRIATIINDISTEIELLGKKLKKYQKIKQGMMQQLLTGKIRLV